MKTLKQILGWGAFVAIFVLTARMADGSGITGVPANLLVTSVTATGNVQGATLTASTSASLGAATASGLTTNSISTTAANTCLTLTSGAIAGKFGCGTTGTTTPIFEGVSGSTVTSAKMYAFYLSIDTASGQECVPLAGSPAFPAGWSAASSGTGLCTITMPAVTTANKVVPIVTAQGLSLYCVNSNTSTTTTIAIKCENLSSAALNGPFSILIMDWN